MSPSSLNIGWLDEIEVGQPLLTVGEADRFYPPMHCDGKVIGEALVDADFHLPLLPYSGWQLGNQDPQLRRALAWWAERR